MLISYSILTTSMLAASPPSLDLRTFQAIHVASEAPADHQMARVLRQELAALYGIDLPIHRGLPKTQRRVILVGRSIVSEMELMDDAELDTVKWDGYLIKAHPEWIGIAGYAPQGTIYGTYAFLKHIGLAHYPWHFGGALKRYEPIPDATLPAFSTSEKPFFELRDVFGQYDQGRFGATIRQYSLGELKWARNLPALQAGGYLGWDHTAGYLAPIQTHITSHPEFYPTLNGTTIPASTQTMQVGICACHPALERITIDNALAWMAHQPTRRLFAITDGDREGWHCPSCADTDPIPDYYTDRNLRWVNAVARAVRDVHPYNRVFTLAYLGTVKPPVETTLEPNALVLYAPWYWTSRATSAVGFDHPLNVTAMEELMAWTRLFPGQIGVYDYTGPWLHGAAERIKFYARHGIRWVYMNGPQGNLLHWVASQLLWNPERDVDALISEFLHAFYGPAADAMHAYYARQRDIVQQRSLTTFDPSTLLQDRAFLEAARGLLRQAAQRAEGTDSHTETRILEGVAEQLYWVLHAEIAMQVETERLRSDFELLLQWHERLWAYCDQFDCSPQQWKLRTQTFEKNLTHLGLPRVAVAAPAKSDRAQALGKARQHVHDFLQQRTPVSSAQTTSTRARYELAFDGPDEAQQWQTWPADMHPAITIEKRSLVGLHGVTLRGVGASVALSRLPLSKRGRVPVHTGQVRLRRAFKPAVAASGQRYVSLHLYVSHAVPVTIYINEHPAFRSDIPLVAGEQVIRIDWRNFLPRQAADSTVDVPDINSITLDIWPQSRFYPYPETHDTEFVLLGLRLEQTAPTPETLPYRNKVIWMSHFRPNIPYGAVVGQNAAGLPLSRYQEERFRSSTPHRILCPIAVIVTETSNDAIHREVVSSLQHRLLATYGVELPVIWQSRQHAKLPLDNAMFLGPVAALAQGQVSVHDLDDLGHSGFVVRARHGAIAIAGKTWQGTQQGISAYLQRDGRRAPATKSSFLHELYLFEP